MTSALFRSLFALFALALAQSASAVDTATPKEALEKTIYELLDILHTDEKAMPYSAKREQIISILEKSFSFDVIIRGALGRNWNKLNSDEQGQVTRLITDLVLRTYTRELKNGPKPALSFSEPKTLTSSKIEIESIVTVNDTDINLSYRLANIRDRGWQVYDVLVEGVSMVSNYRKQFDEHFQKKNARDLIDLLKTKLKEAEQTKEV